MPVDATQDVIKNASIDFPPAARGDAASLEAGLSRGAGPEAGLSGVGPEAGLSVGMGALPERSPDAVGAIALGIGAIGATSGPPVDASAGPPQDVSHGFWPASLSLTPEPVWMPSISSSNTFNVYTCLKSKLLHVYFNITYQDRSV